jgi:hypothetical protein
VRVGKVIVIAISGLGKKIYKSGALVNENNFVKDRFDKLLKGGYIELVEETPEPATPAEDLEPGVVVKDPEPTDDVKDPADEVVKDPKEDDEDQDQDEDQDMTRKQIMADLDYEGIPYDKNMKKVELYALWRTGKNKS